MQTLIELYDERPIENVLAMEVFRPAEVVFLCPAEAAQDRTMQEKLREYAKKQGLQTRLTFLETSPYRADRVKRQLQRVVESHPDCALDITGGTDAALFAGGLLCAESDIPVFTFSRKRGRFYNISGADFADELLCTVQHSVEDVFLMAGGALRSGRVDNSVLPHYLPKIDALFGIYLRYRREWAKLVTYIQRLSQCPPDDKPPLHAEGPWEVKGEQGKRVEAPEPALRDLARAGFLRRLRIRRGEHVAFDFRDAQIRWWLRDVGSALELHVYKACLDTGIFHDVRSSVVVDWAGEGRRDSVTNELDAVAVRGVTPLFVSCKTCAVSTDALNELAILRDRFGGAAARAAIVTAEYCRAVTRHRAAALDIDVIDIADLRAGAVSERIREILDRE